MAQKGEFKDRTGEKRKTTEGYIAEIIEYSGTNNCTIKLNDERGTILKGRRYKDFLRGNIKNPYHPSIFGVGYFGEGVHRAVIKGKTVKSYGVWARMIQRVYSEVYHIKKPSYIGCSVAEEWHNYQVFAEWYVNNYKEDYQMDKDILFKGNKMYSPETCCFVPLEINTLFVTRKTSRGKYPIGVAKTKSGKFEARFNVNSVLQYAQLHSTPEEAFQAYKTAKEEHIKKVADKWKPFIEERVYQAMYNWKIEITD